MSNRQFLRAFRGGGRRGEREDETMAIAARTVTLLDYADEREGVVLFWAGIGCPTGEHTVLGYPDLNFAERNNLLDLSGTVDADGDWNWDGDGKPTDDRGNSITKLQAFIDPNRWAGIVQEYESDC